MAHAYGQLDSAILNHTNPPPKLKSGCQPYNTRIKENPYSWIILVKVNLIDQVSCPYKATSKITIMNQIKEKSCEKYCSLDAMLQKQDYDKFECNSRQLKGLERKNKTQDKIGEY
jgi:hypothetical protein